jgi:hypothetical protein
MLTEIETRDIKINLYQSHHIKWEAWRHVVDSLKLRMIPIAEYEQTVLGGVQNGIDQKQVYTENSL